MALYLPQKTCEIVADERYSMRGAAQKNVRRPMVTRDRNEKGTEYKCASI